LLYIICFKFSRTWRYYLILYSLICNQLSAFSSCNWSIGSSWLGGFSLYGYKFSLWLECVFWMLLLLSIIQRNNFFVDIYRAYNFYNWVVAFVQHVFNVFRSSFAWAIRNWVICCVLDASRFTKLQNFFGNYHIISLAINGCIYLKIILKLLFYFSLYVWNSVSLFLSSFSTSI